MQINIYADIYLVIAESMNLMQSMMNQLGLKDDIEEQMKLMEEQMHLFKDLIPASIAVISILVAFVSQWLSYKIINRIEQQGLYFSKFKSFNLPRSGVWVYLVF